jgi:hemerythrin superfamily protein
MARRRSGGEEEREGFLAKLIPDALKKESTSATKVLQQDHDRVRELFKEYPENGKGGGRSKKEIVGDLIRELTVHTKVEEEIFYPALLARRDEEAEKIVRKSFEEHKIVERLLEELSGMTPRDEQYDAKVTVLRESVEHHAKEEEDELFEEAEGLFSDEELDAMGAEIEDRKKEILDRFARPRRAARSARSSRGGRHSVRGGSRSQAFESSRGRRASASRTRKRR